MRERSVRRDHGHLRFLAGTVSGGPYQGDLVAVDLPRRVGGADAGGHATVHQAVIGRLSDDGKTAIDHQSDTIVHVECCLFPGRARNP